MTQPQPITVNFVDSNNKVTQLTVTDRFDIGAQLKLDDTGEWVDEELQACAKQGEVFCALSPFVLEVYNERALLICSDRVSLKARIEVAHDEI